ncbi:MAG: phenylalanine--tRNA ligase subunit beta, partial [Myxococcota bacterium]
VKDRRCPRYAVRLLSGVKVGPSPGWMQRRLRSVGLHPVCNVVDAVSLVMMEVGYPLQGFDFDRMESGRIVVRAARASETIEAGGATLNLAPDDLVIADARRPVALAGVALATHSAIGPDTGRVLLTAGSFDASAVRSSARKHGLHTEASRRFEHGVDPQAMQLALDRCAQLILELGDGVVHKGRPSVEKAPFVPHVLSVRPERVKRILGQTFEKKEIREALVAFGLRPIRRPSKRPVTKRRQLSSDSLFFQVPSWRMDLSREEDLIEEVARFAGYEGLTAILPPGPSHPWTARVPFAPMTRARDVMVQEGFSEAISSAFHDEQVAELFGFDRRVSVRLDNPRSADRAVMRLSILPALLEATRRRQDLHPKAFDLRLFEVGRTFSWSFPQAQPFPKQPRKLGLLMRGQRYPSAWTRQQEVIDAYDLKAAVEAVLASFSVVDVRWRAIETRWLHPDSATAVEASDLVLGALGRAHPDLLARYGLDDPPVFLAELDIDALTAYREKASGLKGLS